MPETAPPAPAPCRLPASHGLRWFLEPWRAVREKPLLWLLIGGTAGIDLVFYGVPAALASPSPLLALGCLPWAAIAAAWAAWRFTAREACVRPPWRAWAPGALRAMLQWMLGLFVLPALIFCFALGSSWLLPLFATMAVAHCLAELQRHAAGAAAHSGAHILHRRVSWLSCFLCMLLTALLCVALLPAWIFDTGLRALLENALRLIFDADGDWLFDLHPDWLFELALAWWEAMPSELANASTLLLSGVLELALCLTLVLWALLAQALAALRELPLSAALAHAARAMWRNWRACAVYTGALTLFFAALSTAVLLAWSGIFAFAPAITSMDGGNFLEYVLPLLLAASVLLALAAFAHEMLLSPWLMARDMLGSDAMQPVPENPAEAALLRLIQPAATPQLPAPWQSHPARVPALHGVRWLAGAWREIFRKPLQWLPVVLAQAVLFIFWFIICLRGLGAPWLALCMLPGAATATALFMQHASGGPADKFIGPPPPPDVLRARMKRQWPMTIFYNIFVYGFASWCFLSLRILPGEPQAIAFVLPVACVLAWLLVDIASIFNGTHKDGDAILLCTRASIHFITFEVLLAFALTPPFALGKEILLHSSLPSAPALALAALILLIILWALLAQTLAAMLGFPFRLALARAARAMWRNAPAIVLYVLVLGGALVAAAAALNSLPCAASISGANCTNNAASNCVIASLSFLGSENMLDALPIYAGALLLLLVFLPAIFLPPWLMARDMFSAEAE